MLTVAAVADGERSAAARLFEVPRPWLFTLLMRLGSGLRFASDKSFEEHVILRGLFKACQLAGPVQLILELETSGVSIPV